MKERGDVFSPAPDAPDGADLPDEFWDNAVWVDAREPTSVHLKLDPLVFAYFKRGGKGHLTRMQNVLKAYVQAQTGKPKSDHATRDAAE
jgi:uncharacterized protein (DUF4415 family)